MRTSLYVVGAFALLAATSTATANEGGHATWQREAGNQVANLASLQRGARNFTSYCSGCHSLQYIRYSRVCSDLHIAENQCETFLLPPGRKPTDYIKASMPAADAQEWFGKPPPDLSLVARSRGADWVFNFLTTFYADPASRQTGVNNLQLPGTAMPHVLANLQGVQVLKAEEDAAAVKEEAAKDEHTEAAAHEGGTEAARGHEAAQTSPFELAIVGSLTPQKYDEFVRDTVNFLDYVGDPTQVERTGLGIWVVLFLLAFTAIAYMLKKEYWKDVR
jgi:ubiquinol-cytochrome c reductase cytochrome c1 subunit